MILLDLLKYGKNAIEQAGCGNASFDSICLLENVTGFSRTQLFIYSGKELGAEKEHAYKMLVERRCNREPLQYIIGKWAFMGLEFHVGTGCLIPRCETEGLVETVIHHINDGRSTVVFDLCAGTGCVGISIANACPNAKVYLIEKYEESLFYLKRNIIEKGLLNTTAVQGDIFNGFLSFGLPKPDVIVSNPPYITTGEIETLQKEVLFEPVEALDGGPDGLCFYKTIANLWLPYLNNEGILAVECGDHQAAIVSNLFSKPFNEKYCLLDSNNTERIVVVKK